ncbi:MAG: hypothetical protein KME27_16805 [Lyngbya sp. HA4199-MV5]|jgi:hypothetical protein|nr:hypothetical protein [Lyngbya sp. HA4199-MV5]
MNLENLSCQSQDLIEVNCDDRWQVYQRLQTLGIPCQCAAYQPLKVQLHSVAMAIQIWSVVRSVTASRQTLSAGLETCWQLDHFQQK